MLDTVFGAQGAADVVLSPVGICCLQVLTHLHGPDARGGRRRRGGGGDIAAHGGLQAREGAPHLLGLAREPLWPLLTALWALFSRMAAAGGGWRLWRPAGGVLARGGRRRAEECTLQDFLRKSLFRPISPPL